MLGFTNFKNNLMAIGRWVISLSRRFTAFLSGIADEPSNLRPFIMLHHERRQREREQSIANDLVEGKFFLKESEKPLKWDTAVKALENYLNQKFGWVRDLGQTIVRELTISPTQGIATTVVTLTGTKWRINDKLKVIFDLQEITTTPTLAITDGIGSFSAVTFTIPSGTSDGIFDVKVTDGQGGQIIRFLVTL